MPFQIIRNDLVTMQVDAIVNTTNPTPVVGYGVDMGIHQAAGPELLLARKGLGTIPVGSAAITPGFRLPAKYVIHTVCPIWERENGHEVQLLSQAYTNSLHAAVQVGCESVAFPLMSAGNHGFPKEIALQTAVSAITQFLMDHEMMVYLVVFSESSVALSKKLFHSVKQYIDENYVAEKTLQEYGFSSKDKAQSARTYERRRYMEEEDICYDMALSPSFDLAPMPKSSCTPTAMAGAALPMEDLSSLLDCTDDSFANTLLHLIDRSGEKDSVIYKRANVSRQTFSKIRNDPDYTTTKSTALAFAIALHLDLEDTKMLLNRAGLAMTRADKRDIVVEYFILNNCYDIFEINNALFTFDLPLLGSSIK